MAEDDARQEHHDKGAGEAGEEADQEEQAEAFGEAHEAGKKRAGAEAGKHQRTLAAFSPAARPQQRTDEVTGIVGRRDQPGVACGQAKLVHHAGKDRRVDEAADAHGHGHADHAACGETERRGKLGGHGATLFRHLRGATPFPWATPGRGA